MSVTMLDTATNSQKPEVILAEAISMARVGDFDEPLHKAALAIRTKFKRK